MLSVIMLIVVTLSVGAPFMNSRTSWLTNQKKVCSKFNSTTIMVFHCSILSEQSLNKKKTWAEFSYLRHGDVCVPWSTWITIKRPNLKTHLKQHFGYLPLAFKIPNWTTCIRHQCMKTTVFSCHRCLINIGVEKANSI